MVSVWVWGVASLCLPLDAATRLLTVGHPLLPSFRFEVGGLIGDLCLFNLQYWWESGAVFRCLSNDPRPLPSHRIPADLTICVHGLWLDSCETVVPVYWYTSCRGPRRSSLLFDLVVVVSVRDHFRIHWYVCCVCVT